jgi:hypothetical protein
MKHILPIISFCAILMIALPVQAESLKVVAPKGHQAIKAKVVNPEPKNFTINVRMLANMGVNEDAPSFAMYVSGSLPKQCADFRPLKLSYTKPQKYQRKFDLTKFPQVLTALEKYKCVVITNRKPTAI